MIEKIDTTHRYSDRLRRVRPTLLWGHGGLGRELARAGMREAEAHYGAPVPFTLLVESDLCDETGRTLEAPFVPTIPGCYMTLIQPGVNCTAAVAEHAGNTDLDWWAGVDPEAISHVSDTGKLGGYASPQVARFVQEFHNEAVNEFCMAVANRVEAILGQQIKGWEASGPLQVIFFNSMNGAVGNTALHMKDRQQPLLPRPNRVLQVAALLGDRGRVTNRQQARALQETAMTELLMRSLQW